MPHQLHAADRAWPETNCYLDLWIELLHRLGRDPLPLLGLAVAMDWEADHFTFLKPSSADIFAATGVVLHELALWHDTAAQVTAQVAAGAVPILEVDAFYLPDTRTNAYRQTHTKTTIAILAAERGRLEYLHNAGHYVLGDEDFAGVLGIGPHRPTLFPFAELARTAGDPADPSHARALAIDWLSRHALTRKPGNPVSRFAAALPALLAQIEGDPAQTNALCFNTTRQLGGAFGLLADHLEWLGQNPEHAVALAHQAKTLQFQLARAARRNRADPAVTATLDAMAERWERCMTAIGAAARPIRAAA